MKLPGPPVILPVRPAASKPSAPVLARAATEAARPSEPEPEPVPLTAARPARGGQWVLRILSGADAGQIFKMPSSGAAVVGRQRGALVFDDFHVSPLHATFLLREGNVVVRDENSASGVFVRIQSEVPILARTFFSAGERLFRFVGAVEKPKAAAPGRPWPYGAPTPADTLYVVEELLVGHRPGRTAVTAGPTLSIGQTGCDLSFPADSELSAKHCEVAVGPGGARLKDVSDGSGVFLRIAPGTEHLLQAGDEIRIGRQTLKLGS